KGLDHRRDDERRRRPRKGEARRDRDHALRAGRPGRRLPHRRLPRAERPRDRARLEETLRSHEEKASRPTPAPPAPGRLKSALAVALVLAGCAGGGGTSRYPDPTLPIDPNGLAFRVDTPADYSA